MNSINEREVEIAKIAESDEARVALEKHLDEIIEGTGFKGSHRSGQFLKYIVDQAIAGRFELLKERVIGMELLGRPPTYDTGEDAIVPVTASDVRKRLLQHYGSRQEISEFRISLPLGSYIPEITRENYGDAHSLDVQKLHQKPVAMVPGSAAANREPAAISNAPQEHGVAVLDAPGFEAAHSKNRTWMRWLSTAILLVVLNLVLFGVLWKRTSHSELAPVSVLPWSALFSSPHATHLITSDPGIVAIQALTGSRISVSDYPNRDFIPEHNNLTPEVRRICLNMLSGGSAPTVDTQTAVNVAELAQNNSKKVDVQAARYIQFSNLKTDDNFIFLGSPLSDPWVSLFDDQLDFRIVVAEDSGKEIIRNVRPGTDEQPSYIPTAQGGAPGTSYAIIALVQNPDQNGLVLLLAGLNSEGTLAAGKLATDLPRISTTLQKCGIPSSSPLKHFEMLLRAKAMASSPSEFDVVACHILSETSAR